MKTYKITNGSVRIEFLKYLNKLIRTWSGNDAKKYNKLLNIRNAVLQKREVFDLPPHVETVLKRLLSGDNVHGHKESKNYRNFNGLQTNFGSAWGIRKGKLSEEELKKLRKKYTTQEQTTVKEFDKSRFRRRPKSDVISSTNEEQNT